MAIETNIFPIQKKVAMLNEPLRTKPAISISGILLFSILFPLLLFSTAHASAENITSSSSNFVYTHSEYSSLVTPENAVDQDVTVFGEARFKAKACQSAGTCSNFTYFTIEYTLNFTQTADWVNLSIIAKTFNGDEFGGDPANLNYKITVNDHLDNHEILNETMTQGNSEDPHVTLDSGPFQVRLNGTIAVTFHMQHNSTNSISDTANWNIGEIQSEEHIVDSDGDGVLDSQDQCEGHDDNVDVDSDGTPDGCDSLIDNDDDGVGNSEDECEGHDDNVDVDSDGTPDGCDPLIDNDGDGVANSQDQCEGYDDSIDNDTDGTPDGCDTLVDSDSDEVADDLDNCPDTEIGTTVDEFGCAVIVIDNPDNSTTNESTNESTNQTNQTNQTIGGDETGNNSSNQTSNQTGEMGDSNAIDTFLDWIGNAFKIEPRLICILLLLLVLGLISFIETTRKRVWSLWNSLWDGPPPPKRLSRKEEFGPKIANYVDRVLEYEEQLDKFTGKDWREIYVAEKNQHAIRQIRSLTELILKSRIEAAVLSQRRDLKGWKKVQNLANLIEYSFKHETISEDGLNWALAIKPQTNPISHKVPEASDDLYMVVLTAFVNLLEHHYNNPVDSETPR